MAINRNADRHHELVLGSGGFLILLIALTALVLTGFVHENTNRRAETMIAATTAQFSSVRTLSGTELRNMRQHLNAVHLLRAKALGIPGIRSRDHAAALAESGRLVNIGNSPGYHVRPMRSGVPYVTPDTAALLDIIAERFQSALAETGLPPYKFVVTSATRTEEDQRRLRRTNGNAAAVSSHQFGTTVDIHYAAFTLDTDAVEVPAEGLLARDVLADRLSEAYLEMADVMQPQLKAVLGRVITSLQSEGKLLMIYERMQPVYHITVNERIGAS
jgi:hypothetical protein